MVVNILEMKINMYKTAKVIKKIWYQVHINKHVSVVTTLPFLDEIFLKKLISIENNLLCKEF